MTIRDASHSARAGMAERATSEEKEEEEEDDEDGIRTVRPLELLFVHMFPALMMPLVLVLVLLNDLCQGIPEVRRVTGFAPPFPTATLPMVLEFS
jgi:hypothetical protein